jgi:hypothetical protein
MAISLVLSLASSLSFLGISQAYFPKKFGKLHCWPSSTTYYLRMWPTIILTFANSPTIESCSNGLTSSPGTCNVLLNGIYTPSYMSTISQSSLLNYMLLWMLIVLVL